MSQLSPPDPIDQLCQIRDELRTAWLALGNTVDLPDDGLLTPVREHINGLANRLHDVVEDMSDQAFRAASERRST